MKKKTNPKNPSMPVEKTFQYYSALTLNPGDLGTHESGWTITGQICEDWYEWVNKFEATHPKYGIVRGDFENTVFAQTEKGFRHFYKNHPPTEWVTNRWV